MEAPGECRAFFIARTMRSRGSMHGAHGDGAAQLTPLDNGEASGCMRYCDLPVVHKESNPCPSCPTAYRFFLAAARVLACCVGKPQFS
jgi:hypothetical protein